MSSENTDKQPVVDNSEESAQALTQETAATEKKEVERALFLLEAADKHG